MRLTAKSAWEILSEYPDTRGYDLAIRESPNGALSLNDGVVNVDITQHTAQQLRQEIEDWIATADDDETIDEEALKMRKKIKLDPSVMKALKQYKADKYLSSADHINDEGEVNLILRLFFRDQGYAWCWEEEEAEALK